MSWIARVRNHFRSNRLSRDIEREMQFHLAERADDLIAGGMRPADARYEARRRFGNVGLQTERTRERDLFAFVDATIRDLRYAARSLRATPAFTLVAVLSLGLGIGANTAIFSILDAVLLQSLPVTHPEELVRVVRGNKSSSFNDSDWDGVLTNPLWEAIRDRQDVFSAAFAYASTSFDLAAGGEARRITGNWVSGGFFTTLGVRTIVGRAIVASDEYRGCPGVAVLSDGFWRSEYGADPRVLGRSISLDGHLLSIAGVVDPAFHGMSVGEAPQVYVPLCAATIFKGPDWLDRRSLWYLEVVARRKSGLTDAQIRARLGALAPAINEATVPTNWPAAELAEYRQARLSIDDASKGQSGIRTTYRKALYVLMAIVALVLAVACANVANLLLARAAARQREMAVRLAIGASRGRLARQLITESLLLSLAGAAIGIAFATWGGRMLVGLMPIGGQPVVLDLHPNASILAFTVVVATVTGLLFGLVPAWRAGRVYPQAAMKSQGRGLSEGHSRFRTGKALVVAQVALSLVLVAGAGLLVGSWRRLSTLDPGFRRDGVLLVNANIKALQTPEDGRAAVFKSILARLRSLPGVRGASTSSLTPVGSTQWNEVLQVDGFTARSDRDALSWMNATSDGYFATMGIPLLSGRDFDSRDAGPSPKIAIVSASMARKFYGTLAVIGRRFKVQEGPKWSEPVEIIGVAGDSKYASLRDSATSIVYYYQPQQETSGTSLQYELRTDGRPLDLAPAVKAAIAEFGSRISLRLTTLDRQLDDSMTVSRAIALLSGFFGALALLLASIGLYGIMAYTVTRRRNEIGVRIALGAEFGRIVRLVLGDVGRIVITGVTIGIALAVAATRLVSTFLFGVKPTDPLTLGASGAVLLAVGIVAALLPAWRAARLDPVTALREE